MTSGPSSAGKAKTAVLVTHDISEAISMADTVIVLTRRPARVKSIIDIDLGLAERTPLVFQERSAFQNVFQSDMGGVEQSCMILSMYPPPRKNI